jgi:hypothetical protein
MPSIISTKTSGGGGIAVTGDTSGVMELASANGTTAVTIDASQNVGIGTSSPASKLQVSSSNASVYVGLNLENTNAVGSTSGVKLAWTQGGTVKSSIVANTYGNDYMAFNVASDTERMRITSTGLLQFNSGYGSVATAFGCRAWVNFNGTGTVAIRASGNVTSITDNGTGSYTVNFTTAMPDANYSVVTTVAHAGGVTRSTSCDASNYLTSSVALIAGYSTSQYDPSVVNAAVFR